jgi:hypothetical protein
MSVLRTASRADLVRHSNSNRIRVVGDLIFHLIEFVHQSRTFELRGGFFKLYDPIEPKLGVTCRRRALSAAKELLQHGAHDSRDNIMALTLQSVISTIRQGLG